MNVVLVQMDIVWENKQANFATVRRLVEQAAPAEGSLVLLPEMFATGFSMNSQTIAEPYGGDTEKFLGALAKEFRVFVVGGAAMLGRDGKARNKALVFSPSGELLAFYAKMRPFSPGGEHEHYLAGKSPITFRWQDCTVSPFVCYDLRFPELFRDVAAANRPELFVVIANFPDKRIQHWVTLLQARAIENQAYVAGVNRVGTDPYYTYGGRSLVVDPQGSIVADGGQTEGSVTAAIDLSQLRQYREGLPFLKDLKRR